MSPLTALGVVGESAGTPPRRLSDGGVAIGSSLDLGAAVSQNLIVRGRLGWSATGRLADKVFGPDIGAVLGDVGAGADYYLMPINMYFGVTLGLAGVAFVNNRRSDDHRVRHSKAGISLTWDIGKEWWLSGNWAIGIAGRLSYTNVAPANLIPGSDGRLAVWSLGPAFTATYN